MLKDSPGKVKNDSYQLWSTETDIPINPHNNPIELVFFTILRARSGSEWVN